MRWARGVSAGGDANEKSRPCLGGFYGREVGYNPRPCRIFSVNS